LIYCPHIPSQRRRRPNSGASFPYELNNMLLHSGVAFHGHEFSSEQPARPRRKSLNRSAFSTPNARIATTYSTPIPILQRTGRSLSEYIPKTPHTVHFKEPDTMSESGRSVASSIETAAESTAEGTIGKKRRRRSYRTKQTFVLAIPAPTLISNQHLLHLRPRNLLQLQMVPLSGARVIPVIDVRVERRVLKFPKAFRAKGQLGMFGLYLENVTQPVTHFYLFIRLC